ncbi:unnamed protein product [Xylocopa violacea]|uniref:Methionine--tRNA ligase, mitochondrial n=2 Tax=Xylocopa violacea TaxID=135666 RepID=A0ABP1NEM9_XYLVO
MLIFTENILIGTKNCNKRFIMTSRTRLEKALENLEKNPFFDKYANKIAKFQQTSPEEFLQRVESQENKLQRKKVAVCLPKSSHVQCLWAMSFLTTKMQLPWAHIRKNNFSDHAFKHTYITTPIFYVNGAPHIGHAYTTVLADAIARFNAMLGSSVILCTGTDEHGTKVEKAAKASNLPTPEYCTHISRQFQEMCDMFQVEYSHFIRTTEKRHQEAVHYFWNCLEKNGHIYRGKYSGWYNVSEEVFVSDADVVQRSTTNINEAFTESGDVVEWTEEDSYKFRLTSFKDDLYYWLKNENVIQPAVYRTRLIPLLNDLQDLSISRPITRVPWAIPTPSDESHTIYVWLDALVNYLTAVGYPDNSFRKYWPPTIQIIGKDILKFHGIYWPAFLMAAGLEPPKKLVCHGHWVVEDKKMSKSKGNVISPLTAMNDFTQDGLRYFLLRQATLREDANYNELKIKKILNAELADTLGNLINRCCSKSINPSRIIYKSKYENLGTQIASRNIIALEKLGRTAKEHYEECNLHLVVDAVMATLRMANQMFEYHKPWVLSKSKDPDSIRIPTTNRSWEDTKPLHLTKVSSDVTHVSTQDVLFFKKIRN